MGIYINLTAIVFSLLNRFLGIVTNTKYYFYTNFTFIILLVHACEFHKTERFQDTRSKTTIKAKFNLPNKETKNLKNNFKVSYFIVRNYKLNEIDMKDLK